MGWISACVIVWPIVFDAMLNLFLDLCWRVPRSQLLLLEASVLLLLIGIMDKTTKTLLLLQSSFKNKNLLGVHGCFPFSETLKWLNYPFWSLTRGWWVEVETEPTFVTMKWSVAITHFSLLKHIKVGVPEKVSTKC